MEVIEFNKKPLFIAWSLPWDGAAGGRIDTILKHTEPKNKHRVREFFSHLQPISSILGESIKVDGLKATDIASVPPMPIILMSRYRDNIYLTFLNLTAQETAVAKILISSLLHCIYGIALKWETHGELVVWGECQVGHTSSTPVSL